MNKGRTRAIIAVIIVLVIGLAAWFTFGQGKQSQSQKTITIGVVGSTKEEQQIWASVAKTAKAKYGLTIKTKNFTDYNQPNKALKNGDIDLNAFQHYAFLNEWNDKNKGGIVAIGRTYIAPIRLYSKKYTKISQLPKGATIAVPNDATNESRALLVLKNAGLITLKNKALLTVADVVSNKKNLKIKEVAADQAGRVIDSVDAAVVNNDYANPAKLGDKQTIYTEPVNKDSKQWINVIAAKSANKKNKAYLQVVKAYQTAKTKRLYQKLYGTKQVSAWDVTLK